MALAWNKIENNNNSGSFVNVLIIPWLRNDFFKPMAYALIFGILRVMLKADKVFCRRNIIIYKQISLRTPNTILEVSHRKWRNFQLNFISSKVGFGKENDTGFSYKMRRHFRWNLIPSRMGFAKFPVFSNYFCLQT